MMSEAFHTAGSEASVNDNVLQGDNSTVRRHLNSTSLFAFIVTAMLAGSYALREEYLWTADQGIGYIFGIIGASAMMLLLLYPLRKKSTRLSFFLGIRQWFKLHMALGILGPVFILLHCSFNPGSPNSRIALGAMLLMVFSGLIGRFIYSKIHRGLYGSRLHLQEIYSQKKALLEKIELRSQRHSAHSASNSILNMLSDYEAKTIKPASVVGNFVRTAVFSISTRRIAWIIHKKINAIGEPAPVNKDGFTLAANLGYTSEKVALKTLVNAYLKCLRKTAELGFYERLFSLWHMLHLPIFGLLIVTALFHIYAVHSY